MKNPGILGKTEASTMRRFWTPITLKLLSTTFPIGFVHDAWWPQASCTNPMGKVVDSNFKVMGVQNLRIVDASVFPKIPGFFIVTPIYMIAEKASDVILADAKKG